MKNSLPHSPKAYKNLRFLNSPEARPIRILSEFFEPLARFKKEGIKDTIVFFGSARVVPRVLASRELRHIKERFKKSKVLSIKLRDDLHDAKMQYEMSRYYEDAAKLSFMLTTWLRSLDHNHRFVVCSGGGPGIMEAANKGAIKAGGKSVGLNISLPFEQSSNPYVSPNLDFEFHYFFMRKFWFMYLAKALVMFPGGFGTMDELMEVLTLIQTKKVKKHIFVILYGSEYWKQVLNFDAMVKYGTISIGDLKLFKMVDTPEEAFNLLKKDISKYYLKRRIHLENEGM